MVLLIRATHWINKNKLPIVSVAVAALIVLGAALYFGELRFYDEIDYTSIARNLSETGVYGYNSETPTAFRPPGYVLFLSALFTVSDSVALIQTTQVVLWGVSALLAAVLASRIQGEEAAGIAFVFCLIYPTFAFTALTLYPQTLTSTILLAVLVILLRPNAGKLSFAEMLAVALGLTALLTINPLMLLFVLVAGPIVNWVRRAPPWQILPSVLFAISILALWMLRNYLVLGADFTVATNLGYNLLLGNSEFAAPNLGTTTNTSAYRSLAEGLGEVAENEYYRNAAVTWIMSNPAQTIELYFSKFLNYFNYANTLATPGEQSSARDAVLFISYYSILAMAALRLLWSKRYPLSRSEIVLLLIYLGAGLAYSIFFNRIRFRIPFDYLIIIIASNWLGHIIQSISLRSGPRQDSD